MSETARMTLKAGREKSLLRRHPWIFSGAVERVENAPEKGGTLLVVSKDGKPLAKAAYSPDSQIVARVWSFEPEETIDAQFMRSRIEKAFAFRKSVYFDALPDAFRLVNAESDGLPGLIVDVYGKTAVCQFAFAGAEFWKKEIAQAIAETVKCEGVYERGDIDARQKEGLPQNTGSLLGLEPPELIQIAENGTLYCVDVRNGHKTGFYLDQRESRKAALEYAKGADSVLNCFCYTGGFGLAALKGGASHALNIDLSADALTKARANASANGFDENRFETKEDDVFQALRKMRDSRQSFDMIILDPPKFADSKNHVEKAARGYKDINLLGMKLLRPGGTLFTFSCSAAIDCDLFQKIVAGAALDAKRDLKITAWTAQAPDHPVDLAFPEGRYLKGLICKIQ